MAVDVEVGSKDRRCARPDCTDPARATLSFSYHDQQAVLTRLTTERRPQAYDLCPRHAARTTAPHGWHLRDDRPEDERADVDAPAVPSDLGSDRTVAVLAAALRAVPSTSTSTRAAEREPTTSALVSTEPSSGSQAAATEPDPVTIDALIDLDDELPDAPSPAEGPTAAVPPGGPRMAALAERREPAQPTASTERPAPGEPAQPTASTERPAPGEPTDRPAPSGPTSRAGPRKPRPVLAARGPEAVPGDPAGPAADW